MLIDFHHILSLIDVHQILIDFHHILILPLPACGEVAQVARVFETDNCAPQSYQDNHNDHDHNDSDDDNDGDDDGDHHKDDDDDDNITNMVQYGLIFTVITMTLH